MNISQANVSWFRTILMSISIAILAASPLFGAATISGDVIPQLSDPLTWTSSTEVYVGRYDKRRPGRLDITDGSKVHSRFGHVGELFEVSGTVAVDGDGSTWTNAAELVIGVEGIGVLHITNGGAVNSAAGCLGLDADSDGPGLGRRSTGMAMVDGAGSTWTNAAELFIGRAGDGALHITNGGAVSNHYGLVGYNSSGSGTVTVDGPGSTWTNSRELYVGDKGAGTLTITNGGLVTVSNRLVIDRDLNGDGWINMSTGGMLALGGQADASLDAFLDLIGGTDAVNYWDAGLNDWADITLGTRGPDYSLTYWDTGDLAGFTVLKVGGETPSTVPAPSALLLASTGLILVRRWRYRRI